MGAALILESQVLFKWSEMQGFGPLCSHGISMGGHMACLAASAWCKPICLVPCLAWTSASVTFCQGVMADAINWKQLYNQYENNDEYKKVWNLLHSPEFEQDRIRKKDEFLADSFLSANRKVSLKFFRENDNEDRTDIEAFNFMRGLMDECTHLGNYSVPVDADIIEIVAAKYDAYQPRRGVKPLNELWQGSNIRFLEDGHVSSYIFRQNLFRKAIYDSFDKYALKYS